MVQARREQLFENQRKRLENQIQRFRENFAANDDESSGSEEYSKTSKISYFHLIFNKKNISFS